MQTNGAKPRARLQILWYVCQFSLMQRHESGQGYTGSHAFKHARHDDALPPGSLIAIQSAPLSKWYLSWLIEYQWPADHHGPTYVLESIEDGEVCNWSNVGVMAYDPEAIKNNPQWRWTDEQFAFNDRWHKAASEAYMRLPMRAQFVDGQGVILQVRQRHEFDRLKPAKCFTNWKKVTKKQMVEFYNTACIEIDQDNERIKAEAQKAAG